MRKTKGEGRRSRQERKGETKGKNDEGKKGEQGRKTAKSLVLTVCPQAGLAKHQLTLQWIN